MFVLTPAVTEPIAFGFQLTNPVPKSILMQK